MGKWVVNSKSAWMQALSVNPWFNSVPQAERKAMLAAADVLSLRPGEMLFRKGDTGGGFFAVLSGALKVSTLGEDGREGILSVLEVGIWFGETSHFDGAPRPHDVTAVEATEVLVIAPAAFARLMRRNAFAYAMAVLMSVRIRALYGLVEDSMLRTTSTRIARRLLALTHGDATMSPVPRTHVAVSQEALAMMLGITRQTLSKELKAMARAGVLSLGYGCIEIISLSNLEACAALS
jgi:CRP/FNR family cyclic AMP-dependent transcriptional regulator